MKQIESAKTRIWKGHAKTETGIRHERRGMKCQDYTEMEKRDGKIAMALLDGRGETDVNAQAVKRIAKKLNDFMITFFEEIYQSDEETVAYNLMSIIEQEISELSKEYKVNPTELASTLLGFCIDDKQEKYCAVHLGDGVIALKNNSDTIQLLSLPTNGVRDNQTILTTTESALKYVKVYRGSTKGIKGVLMASDGIYNGREDQNGLVECFSNKAEDVILGKKVDDQSMITIHV